jgi:serine/threonine protein kinase
VSESPDTTPRPFGDDALPLLALIAAEIDLHLHHGEKPDVDDFCRRFPEVADLLRERWHLFLAGSGELSASTVAPALPDVATVLAAVGRVGLVEPEELRQFSQETADKPRDALQLARDLIQRGWLTAFQVNQLLQGKEAALHVGPYQLLHRLGEGGMGQVYKARHGRLGRVVALKLIHPQFLCHPSARKRFLREVRSLSLLDHPNIVSAIDAGDEEGKLYLAMQFIEGTDLARLVKEKGAMPIGQACDCVRQAALGLQHAHEHGLVHRDVKPANLLLTPDGTVKILDLGLARLRESGEADHSSTLTDTGIAMGTPDYVAPEQITDSKHVDIRADLYSLGCTLYHLLAGQPPFAGGTAGLKVFRQQTEEPEAITALRGDVPAALAAVVQKLMAKRPEERYQSPAEVAAVLDHLLRTGKWAGGPFAGVAGWSASPASWLNRARPSWQGRRLLKALAVAVVVLSLAGLALWIWPGPRPGPPDPGSPEPPPVPRSPLDDLTFEKIPAQEKLGNRLLPEVVQVLGSHQGQHGSFVRCVAFHPDGKFAYSGGNEGVVRVWDTATMFPQAALDAQFVLASVAVVREPGGEPVLWASNAIGVATRWDAQTLRPQGRLKLPPVRCFSPDGRYLCRPR